MKYLVYDLEIRKAILQENQMPLPNIEYCNGWGDFENMGISVLGMYVSWEDRYLVWFKNCKEYLTYFRDATYLVGFNNVKFDNKVLKVEWNFPWMDSDCFDILRESWSACGFDPDRPEGGKGFTLNNFSENNLGESKRGHGAQAPVLWQQGKWGEVINYCLDDVAKTKKLFERILRDGYLIHPKEKDRIIRYEL